jgi:MoxR-like ATPase
VGGGVFLFDEIDASSAQALLAFNAIAANDLAAFPCGTVKRHADFVIIAAANTWGSGADAQYVGRAQLDAATLDRFAFISMDYDERLELAISSNDEWTRYVQAFRRITRQLKIRAVVSPRASIKGGKLLSAGLSWNRVEEMLLIRGLSANEVEQVRAQLPQRKVA